MPFEFESRKDAKSFKDDPAYREQFKVPRVVTCPTDSTIPPVRVPDVESEEDK